MVVSAPNIVKSRSRLYYTISKNDFKLLMFLFSFGVFLFVFFIEEFALLLYKKTNKTFLLQHFNILMVKEV